MPFSKITGYSFLALFLCINTSVFAQSNGDRVQGEPGGSVTYGEFLAHDSLNPYTTENNATAVRMISILYESLVYYDYNRDQVVPLLAQSWDAKNDGVTFTFYLRPNIKWHDGVSFTAEDVKFTFNYVTKSQVIPREKKARLKFIQSVTVLNTHTIQFVLKKKISDPLLRFTFEIVPKHMFQDNYLPAPGTSGIDAHPIGTGPYKFDKVTPDGRAKLVAFEDYWDGRPFIDKFVRRLDTDPNVQTDALRFGALDMVLEARTTDIAVLREMGAIRVQAYPSLSYYFIGMNMQNPVLKNKSVRQAIVYGTNREEMLEKWYGGYGEVISGPFTPRSWAYNPNVLPYRYDISESQRLLIDAGCVDTDGDGFLELNGKPIEFNLKVPIGQTADSPVYNVALAFEAYMKKIGIRILVTNQPLNRWKEDVMKNHNFDFALARWTFDPVFNITPLFYSSNSYPGGKNFISYNNEQIDLLLEHANEATDSETIRGIYHRIHQILADDVPYVFLFTVNKFVAHHIRIFNVTIDPFYFFKDVKDWYIPEEWQR